jgi:hypothetical protein
VLSGAGFIPVVGAAFDIANALISFSRGDDAGGWISLISAVPGVGDAIGFGLKAGAGIAKATAIGTRSGQIARAVGVSLARNVADQSAKIAFGRQQEFEFEQTLGAAVSSGLLGPLSVGAGRALGASRNPWLRAATLATGSGLASAAGDLTTQGGAILAGRQDEFDWNLASTAFGSGVLAGAVGQTMGLFDKTCFAAGTPLLTPAGSRPIEQFQPGDTILARDEHNPDAPVVARQVEEAFVRQGWLRDVRIGGRTILTTGEHPFYVLGHGWKRAVEL